MRKNYTVEYKNNIVKLVLEEGRKATEVSHEMDIPYGTLTQWIQKHRKEIEKSDKELPLSHIEYKERLVAYEREMQTIKEENEILKKAVHIFTKND